MNVHKLHKSFPLLFLLGKAHVESVHFHFSNCAFLLSFFAPVGNSRICEQFPYS